jgi:hypothetical protein
MNLLLEQWGVSPLLFALEKGQSEGEVFDLVRARCHDIAHLIGETEVKRTRSPADVLQSCSAVCASGCFHGAIQGWAAQGHSIVSELSSLCDVSAENVSACFHGVGHGLVDVVVQEAKEALMYCDQAPQEGRWACANGVLMELYQPGLLTAGRYPLPENHPSWCFELHHPYDEVCFQHAGVFFYNQSGDLLRGMHMCRIVPAQYQGVCFGEIAKKRYFVWPLEEDMIKQAKNFCQQETPLYYEACLSNFLKPPA